LTPSQNLSLSHINIYHRHIHTMGVRRNFSRGQRQHFAYPV